MSDVIGPLALGTCGITPRFGGRGVSGVILCGGDFAAPEGEVSADLAESDTKEDAAVVIDEISRFIELVAEGES